MRLVTFALGIVVGAVFSSIAVSAWTGPSSSPPNSNIPAPINVGSTNQVKNANLGVNGLAVFGNSILQASSYLNWGATAGSSGYGIWDNAGTLEFKNSGGSWASIQATVASLVNTSNPSFNTSVTSPQYCIGSSCITSWPGGSSWATSGTNIYNTNSGSVGVGTSNPTQKLEVNGYVKADTGFCIGATCITSWPSGGSMGGSGTASYVAKFTGASTLGNSLIYDNGSDVGIGTASPSKKLQVAGMIYSTAGGFEFPDGTTQSTAAPTSNGISVTAVQCGGATSCSATCSAGKVATGGSCNLSGTWAYLSSSGGTTNYSCYSNVATTLYATVYCANP